MGARAVADQSAADAIPITPATAAAWLFRIGIASCFIGHGAFGILTKQAWLPYFALVGIGPDTAYALMPLVGFVDIGIGLVGLVSPRRAVLVYMVVWAAWTALLRPLTGESMWELVERAGNYGIPLAFLLAARVGHPRRWLAPIKSAQLPALDALFVARVLQATTVLLLLGHGALAVTGANGLVARHLAAAGVAAELAPVLGGFEIGLAVAVALQPAPGLLVGIALWKLGTELLFPVAGAPFWEVVERGGSYTAPLLLAHLVATSGRRRSGSHSLGRFPLTLSRFPLNGRFLMRITRSLLPFVFLVTVVPPAEGLQRSRRQRPPPLPTLEDAGPGQVLTALRGGGHILACRHAITDRSGGHRGPIDLSDRSTQRNLSAAGEEQARSLGRAMRRLDIPIGEVHASPYARTMETAQLAFGRATPDRMLYGDRPADARRERFNRRPVEGNAVLMTHQAVLRSVLRYRQPGEGDCIVVRPTSDGPEVVANVTVPEWERLAAWSGRRP